MEIKSLAVKSAIGLVGIGGTGVAIQQVYKSLTTTDNKDSIENKLKEEKYTPLTKGSPHFTEILQSYKTIVQTKKELQFGTFTGDAPDNTKIAADILWEHCQTAFSSKSTDTNSETLFNKAKKWCVVPISVTSILSEQGIKSLKTDSVIDETEKAKWTKKITEYKKQENSSKRIATFTLDGDQITEENYTKIKEKCTQIGAIKSHQDKYEDNLKDFDLWCTDK